MCLIHLHTSFTRHCSSPFTGIINPHPDLSHLCFVNLFCGSQSICPPASLWCYPYAREDFKSVAYINEIKVDANGKVDEERGAQCIMAKRLAAWTNMDNSRLDWIWLTTSFESLKLVLLHLELVSASQYETGSSFIAEELEFLRLWLPFYISETLGGTRESTVTSWGGENEWIEVNKGRLWPLSRTRCTWYFLL